MGVCAGVKGMNRTERKRFREEQWTKLGGKPKKGEKIGAHVGIPMVKKHAHKAKEQLEEGIQSGMIDGKGIGKKKRRLRGLCGDCCLNSKLVEVKEF